MAFRMGNSRKEENYNRYNLPCGLRHENALGRRNTKAGHHHERSDELQKIRISDSTACLNCRDGNVLLKNCFWCREWMVLCLEDPLFLSVVINYCAVFFISVNSGHALIF
jgi:hypothetical protein